MNRPICFLDTETSGLHPDRRAWEIAIIRRKQGQPDTSILIQITDVDLSSAQLIGLNIGGFYERHINYANELADGVDVMTEATAAKVVESWTRNAIIVGAVPSFDTEVLGNMLRRHRLVPAWHHRLRCVETLTAGHLRQDIGGLTKCAEALGITVDPKAEHTAMGDASTARAIWDAVMTVTPTPAPVRPHAAEVTR